jgi:hypothetical protein
MEKPSVLLAALVCSLIGGLVAGFFYLKLGPVSDIKKLDFVQPDTEFVWSFSADSVADLPNFYKALKVKSEGGPAVFRRNMVLKTDTGCSQPGELKDAGWVWVSHPDPCKIQPDMGQQVTQRVGFHNQADLDKALSYLSQPH